LIIEFKADSTALVIHDRQHTEQDLNVESHTPIWSGPTYISKYILCGCAYFIGHDGHLFVMMHIL